MISMVSEVDIFMFLQGVSLEDGRVPDKVAKEQGCII